MDVGEEALDAVEVGGAFGGDEIGVVFLAGVVPALRDASGVLGCVDCANAGEADLGHEAFILTGRAVFVKADRTARRDFFCGNHSGDHESVGEEDAAVRIQDAKDFGEDAESAGKVAHDVIREDGVESFFVEEEILRSVHLLETRE